MKWMISVALSAGLATAGAVVSTTAAHAAGRAAADGVIAAVSGGGWYLLQNAFETQFAFTAVLHQDEHASGAFHHRTEDANGTIDFQGEVTCLAVDTALGRAWIGGVITVNDSTNPAFNTPIHQVGHDIWFRVLDNGQGHADPDRTTFVGFEGAIPSSAEYCRQQIWPAGDARTWPVTEGNLDVR